MVVKSELEKLGLNYGAVDLGEVEIKTDITAVQREQLKIALLKSGLELMDDKKAHQSPKKAMSLSKQHKLLACNNTIPRYAGILYYHEQ